MLHIEDANKYVDQGIELVMQYAPKLLLAIIVLLVGLWLINSFAKVVDKGMEARKVEPTLRHFLKSLVSIIFKILLMISVASLIGIATTSFVAVIGAAGLAIGLALQGSLANFAGGVLILFFRPFKVGDFIQTNSYSGTVKEIQIFNTIMTTPDNKRVIIPNGKVSNDSLINFSSEPTRRVDFVFGVSYGANIDLVKETLKGILDADERIHKEPAPMVVLSELADSSVNFTVRAWVDAGNYWPVFFETMETVKKTFDTKGIEIPFPQRDVYIHQAK
ncbi:MAG: mechanosensitive ion channel domain-containing protein [Pseudomonadota bacterium]|uniref:mechanosensitive ion channel family protein n=1 Tax=Gallaecimonas pentaromativorans TaxID=584787 RepID=UPI00067E69F3|nr:mechanosensitive ion channel domain-containing protein [Gallaecimonas pentaromativorans]MED5524584.1 mechanosensitive ion channel domain-containing protein [Pseudomonadota bacterium]